MYFLLYNLADVWKVYPFSLWRPISSLVFWSGRPFVLSKFLNQALERHKRGMCRATGCVAIPSGGCPKLGKQRKELSRRKEIFAHDDKLKLTGDARNGRRRIPTLEEDSEVMSTKRDEQRKQLEI